MLIESFRSLLFQVLLPPQKACNRITYIYFLKPICAEFIWTYLHSLSFLCTENVQPVEIVLPGRRGPLDPH